MKMITVVLQDLIRDRQVAEIELERLMNQDVPVEQKILNVKEQLSNLVIINESIKLWATYLPQELPLAEETKQPTDDNNTNLSEEQK